VCGHGTNDWISPHASGHIEFADGTHLHSTIVEWCDAPYPYGPTSLVAFRSSDGIQYEYVGTVITSLAVPEVSAITTNGSSPPSACLVPCPALTLVRCWSSLAHSSFWACSLP
jgi:hypothetical protein